MSRQSVMQQIRDAKPIESGPGYKVYSINTNGGTRDVITINYSYLTKMVRQAEKFASKNGGDLPNTKFWNLTVSIFREDKGLFRELHKCRELLAVLRRNERFDRLNPPRPIQQPQTIGPPPGTSISPPVNLGELPGATAVPEPSSVLLMGIGLLAAFVIGRRNLAGKRPAPAGF